MEAVEAVEPGGREGRAIVAADRLRESTGPEQVPEVGFHPSATGIRQALTGEEIAAEVVDDGERVAVGPVPHPELPLEVDGPDLVRRGGLEGRGARVLPAAPLTPRGPILTVRVERRALTAYTALVTEARA